jgi:hypothetical protein
MCRPPRTRLRSKGVAVVDVDAQYGTRWAIRQARCRGARSLRTAAVAAGAAVAQARYCGSRARARTHAPCAYRVRACVHSVQPPSLPCSLAPLLPRSLFLPPSPPSLHHHFLMCQCACACACVCVRARSRPPFLKPLPHFPSRPYPIGAQPRPKVEEEAGVCAA